LIVNITKEEDGIVTVHEDKRHPFIDGDIVTFREVQGMSQVNGQQFKVRTISPHSFAIGDTTGFGDYQREGICEQVKVAEEMAFKSFE